MVIETPDGEIIKLKGENSKHPYARVVTDEQGNHTLEITKA
jgi:hypothetical protein